MAFEGVPWMIGGNQAVHSADVGRRLAFMASSGATGITLPGDLRVTALPTPGGAVRILPGGGPIANTYSGGSGQSYVVSNPTSTDLSIPATGSGGGATRYVIVRIDDPQYGGAVPADPANGPYVKATYVSTLSGITYPYMPLAKIVQPANTATITQSMITDMREMAMPREKTVVYARPNITGDAGLVLNGRQAWPDGEWFPNVGGQDNNGIHYIDIPKWATRMEIRAEWIAVRLGAKAGYGDCWVTYGPGGLTETPTYATQSFAWDADEGSNVYRANWILHDEKPVLSAWRGTTQPFVLRANKRGSATTYPGSVELTATSGVVLSVRFQEVADE